MSTIARVFEQDSELKAIPTPHVTELMLELLDLKPTDKLLEIGTGSQTQTLEWAKHCEVTTIELSPVISADYLGRSVYFRVGDGGLGCPGQVFDAIVATCGVEKIPEAWKEQLCDGGRLVIPFGSSLSQKLTRFVKRNGMLSADRIAGYVRFQMLKVS